MEKREWTREMRTAASDFQTREDGDNLLIEGYFSVFNSIYEIAPGMTESIAPGAFTNALKDESDVRALTNHDTTLVLGRTKARTLELKEDKKGLWGQIVINPNDGDALNLYERVKRGDVDQCSFGFDIVSEATDYRDDGSIHWEIQEVKLYEVSVCTFPAYDTTSVSARTAAKDEIVKRSVQAWRENMKARLRHGVKSTDATQED